jgi:hypothetical protein
LFDLADTLLPVAPAQDSGLYSTAHDGADPAIARVVVLRYCEPINVSE